MSSSSPNAAIKQNLSFADVWAAIAPSLPVLMQTAEADFGSGSGSEKMEQVTNSLVTTLQVAAPLVAKNNPQHVATIVAAAQGVFNLLKISGGLSFVPPPANKVPNKD